MKQIKLINLENISEDEVKDYKVREAVRAVVFDQSNLVPLIYSTVNNYAKLPGGGVEEGENMEQTLKRECLEEIGCNVEIIQEIGMIVEYRSKYKLKQVSYCYLAKLIGEKGTPQLDEGEKEQGFETIWITIDEAIEKVTQKEFVMYESEYVTIREKTFLETAKNIYYS